MQKIKFLELVNPISNGGGKSCGSLAQWIARSLKNTLRGSIPAIVGSFLLILFLNFSSFLKSNCRNVMRINSTSSLCNYFSKIRMSQNEGAGFELTPSNERLFVRARYPLRHAAATFFYICV